MADKRKPGFPAPDDEDALYRVRDRNEPHAPGYVWGEDLSLEEAQKLKEKVAASGKSKTVRYEPMAEPYPPDELVRVPTQRPAAPSPKTQPIKPAPASPTKPRPKVGLTAARLEQIRGERQGDPRLEQMRQVALGAASGAAAEAQARADKLAQQKKLTDSLKNLTPGPANDVADDADPDGLTDSDLSDLLGEVEGEASPEDIAAAKALLEEEQAKADAEKATESEATEP